MADIKLNDADLIYLELTAKHAPQELGSQHFADCILQLIQLCAEQEEELDEYADSLEEIKFDKDCEVDALTQEIDQLQEENEELQERIQELAAAALS
jgi:FtsZ-binding cell division protein ZapB